MAYKINVHNVYMAEITESPGGELTFGKPEHIIGAMEVSRTPNIATGQLYGDGKVAHSTSKKTSYEISLQQNAIPSKWRRYMEGTTYNNGIESGSSKDQPKPFAIGWEIEKTEDQKELIWFLYCKANPLEQTVQQSDDNINYSTDSVTITATEHDSLGRYYTFIDTEDENVTPEMVTNFFKKVQTTDTVSAA